VHRTDDLLWSFSVCLLPSLFIHFWTIGRMCLTFLSTKQLCRQLALGLAMRQTKPSSSQKSELRQKRTRVETINVTWMNERRTKRKNEWNVKRKKRKTIET
jgi:hypothetical protein